MNEYALFPMSHCTNSYQNESHGKAESNSQLMNFWQEDSSFQNKTALLQVPTKTICIIIRRQVNTVVLECVPAWFFQKAQNCCLFHQTIVNNCDQTMSSYSNTYA